MTAFFSCPESAGASNVPSQPFSLTPGCTWALPPSSWKIPGATSTREQSIGSSSGSVTFTRKSMPSPQPWMPPCSGISMSTVGRVLPAVITSVDVPDLPVVSVTSSLTVYWPGSVKVWVGFGSFDTGVPSPKFHS
jgi:hypothetical protein